MSACARIFLGAAGMLSINLAVYLRLSFLVATFHLVNQVGPSTDFHQCGTGRHIILR